MEKIKALGELLFTLGVIAAAVLAAIMPWVKMLAH
jgi:hypothetical protein